MIKRILESVPLELSIERKIQISDEDFKLIEAMVQHAAGESSDMNAELLIKTGNILVFRNKQDLALQLYEEARKKAKANNQPLFQAYSIVNTGTVISIFEPKDKNELSFIQQAIEILKGTEHRVLYAELNVRAAKKENNVQTKHSLLNEALSVYQTMVMTKEQAAVLEKIARLHRDNDIQEFLKLLHGAIALYRQNGDIKEAGGLLNEIAEFYAKAQDHATALEYFRQVLELFQSHQYQKETADSLQNIGKLHNAAGRTEEAFEFFHSALKLYQTAENDDNRKSVRHRVFELYYDLACIYDSRKDIQTSLDYYIKAYEKAKETNFHAYIGFTASRIGSEYESLFDYDQAIRYFTEAVQYGYRDEKDVAGDYLSIGINFSNINEQEKALDYLHQSLERYRKIPSAEGEATALGNIGLVYIENGKTEKAMTFIKDALAIAREHKISRVSAWLLLLTGLVYRDRNAPAEAFPCFEEGLLISRESGHPDVKADLLQNIGRLYRNQGDPEKAKRYFLESLNIRTKYYDQRGLAVLYNDLGGVFFELNETNQATTYLLKGLELHQKIHDVYNERFCLLMLRDIYKMNNDLSNLNMINKRLAETVAALESHKRRKTFVMHMAGPAGPENG